MFLSERDVCSHAQAHMDGEANLQCKHGRHFYHTIQAVLTNCDCWVYSVSVGFLYLLYCSLRVLRLCLLRLMTALMHSPESMEMSNGDLPQVTNHFSLLSQQIWRPLSATLYFPVGPGTGFLYLVNLYFLYQYSSRLETGIFCVYLNILNLF